MPPILDVAIGLIFVYLLFSLVVTATKEVLISFLASSWDARAKMLKQGISEMLRTPVGQGFTKDFYDHPLVKALSPAEPGSLPNYIPRETFVSTVLDLLAPPGVDGKRSDAGVIAGINGLVKNATLEILRETLVKVAKIIQHTKIGVALAKIDDLKPRDANPPSEVEAKHKSDLKTALEALGVELKRSLETREQDLQKANGEVETAKKGGNEQAIDDAEKDAKLKQSAVEEAEIANAEIGAAIKSLLDQEVPLKKETVADFIQKVSLCVRRWFENAQLGVAERIAPKGTVVSRPPPPVASEDNGDLQRALQCLWAEADGDLGKFKESLGTWFDRSMDRVTGWYKKHSQYVLFFIALVFAVSCNMDTLRIVDVLSTDPKLREAIVQSATDYVNRTSAGSGAKLADAKSRLEAATAAVDREKDQAKKAEAQKAVDELKKDVEATEKAWSAEVAKAVGAFEKAEADATAAKKKANEAKLAAEKPEADPKVKATAAETANTEAEKATKLEKTAKEKQLELAAVKSWGGAEPTDQLANAVRQMNGFGLPIGWAEGDWDRIFADPRSIWRAMAGWLITALAASLGAPFWFDTLNKIITIRAGGRAPEEKDPGENGNGKKANGTGGTNK